MLERGKYPHHLITRTPTHLSFPSDDSTLFPQNLTLRHTLSFSDCV